MSAMSRIVKLTPEQHKAHRISWFVYAGGEMIPRESTMRGQWGYDAKCSCGWESRTGGGTRSYVEDMIANHKFDVMIEGEKS
jgi:hypothetical protein